VDQLGLERLGIPTVSIATTPFKGLVKATVAAEGADDACFVYVPSPLGMIAKAEVEKKAEQAFVELLKAATDWRPAENVKSAQPVYPADRFAFSGSARDVHKLFLARGWSLGLPVVPPTADDVTEMLKGTQRQPEEVIGLIPPRMGVLTVELLAVHAVMAGCKPEYMPLLIGALEALLEPEAGWRSALTTTASTQFLVIVNGPVSQAIGLACSEGAAGKGHHPNVSIGYAINLVAYAVGGSQPHTFDKSTLGSPGDCVCWVFGENEDRLPSGWQPLHVDRGFRPTDSTVTVLCSYPAVANIDHWSTTPAEQVRWWSHLISPMTNIGGPGQPLSMKHSPIVALSPEHAQVMASAGWSKDDFRQALWEQARIPLSAWPAGCTDMKLLVELFGPVQPESLIPITLEAKQFLVLVAGGAGKQSHYFAQFPMCQPVTRLIGA
jgi:hypothetical protein